MANTAIQPRAKTKSRSFPNAAEILELANLLYKGGMTSKSVTKPEALAVKIVAGMEVGLSPVQSCNNIMIVGGRATIYGDGALALVRNSGLLASINETIEGEDVEACAVCVVHRKGDQSPREFRFAVTDAMKARLWGNDGPWSQYPLRMLAMRARGMALRDVFTDVLSGLGIFEESQEQAERPKIVVDAAAEDEDLPATKPESPIPGAECLVDGPTLEKIAAARDEWMAAMGVDRNNVEAVRFEWAGKLHFYNCESARQLTQSMAENLLRDLIREANPEPPKLATLPDIQDLTPAA